jgi:hypothetical protein
MLRGNPPSPRARGALKKNLRPPEPKGSGGGQSPEPKGSGALKKKIKKNLRPPEPKGSGGGNPPSPRARGAFKKKFVAPGGY